MYPFVIKNTKNKTINTNDTKEKITTIIFKISLIA